MHEIIYQRAGRTGLADLDGLTEKNLPYFVMENLPTLTKPHDHMRVWHKTYK